MNFVDGNGGVDDGGCNGFPLHNGLDSLVGVVVDVLASNNGSNGVSVLRLANETLVLKLGSLYGKTRLDILGVAVLEVAVLDGNQVVLVLLREDLTVKDRLDRSVVVVLVDLLVDGSDDLLVSLWGYGLVDDSRGNLLVDGGVVVTRLGHELLDGAVCFGRHDDKTFEC